MPYLSVKEKLFFRRNGYLFKHDVLTDRQISNALDALWTGIRADRRDPDTWVGAGPRSPVEPNHPALEATVTESPVFEIAEELAGKGTLRPCGPEAAINYPSSHHDAWSLPRVGHIDGYYMPFNGVPEGTVDRFMLAATIYLSGVEHKGGSFLVWPGSHLAAMEYFKTHALLDIRESSPEGAFEVGPGKEFNGPAGSVCFWHGQLIHTAAANASRDIRMGLICRFRRWDVNDILFETPDDVWEYWEPLKSLED